MLALRYMNLTRVDHMRIILKHRRWLFPDAFDILEIGRANAACDARDVGSLSSSYQDRGTWFDSAHASMYCGLTNQANRRRADGA